MCPWKHKTQPKHDSIHTDGNHLVNNMLWWREMGNGYEHKSGTMSSGEQSNLWTRGKLLDEGFNTALAKYV